jgi:two-component system sensor histidine kinase RegB
MHSPWYLAGPPAAREPWQASLYAVKAGLGAAVASVSWSALPLDLSLSRVAPLLLVAAAANALAVSAADQEADVRRAAAALVLVVEIVLMAALLELTGGPFNPFVVVFVVQTALAALTLGAGHAWTMGLLSAACYATLVHWHLNEPEPWHHRASDFPTHLYAMWLFLATSADLALFFAGQASRAIAEREAALDVLRARAARSERIASLTTLAAGAAHELSTPLGTIALAARELERNAVTFGGDVRALDDVRLIRSEVDRCRRVLDQMTGRAAGAAEDRPEEIALSQFLQEVRDRLPESARARVQVELGAPASVVHLPRAGLRQSVLALINNACDAARGEVILEAHQQDGRLTFTVRDDGGPISAEVLARAGDPFFTTKEPGRGMGLGLFLARIFAERFGGSVTLESGGQTVARLDLPSRAECA